MRSLRSVFRVNGDREAARPHPWSVMLCALLFGLTTAQVEVTGPFAAIAIGALLALNSRLQARILVAVLALAAVISRQDAGSLAFWLVVGEALLVAVAPRHVVSTILRIPRSAWQILVVVSAAAICAMLLNMGPVAVIVASLGSCYVSALVVRHMALADARLLTWGDQGLVAVTRDLLLGRITSGMLHDLAQPLNVISMANGNLGYIASHLPIGEDERRQLLDRIDRIALHTKGAATILGIFRWFGRDGSDNAAELSVRSALERAIAATRSNVRHHDVAVNLEGNGLEYLLPERHGYLEMMAVAALLCAFGSFILPDGTKSRGKVLLHATLSPAYLTVSVQCTDTDGAAVIGRAMDHATMWLVEQVAHEASGDFRMTARSKEPERFVIRLGRDDI
jgi:signal transduction histidine kinase